MASFIVINYYLRRNMERERIFRDRINPLDCFSDDELYEAFRFRRNDIIDIVNDLRPEIEVQKRSYTVPAHMQVMVALRFFATGTFQSVVGDTVGISQPTISRIIHRVSRALVGQMPAWVYLPSQEEAEKQKINFFGKAGFPSVIGCIDGTHVRIQAPSQNEHEYVNRKNYHSVNVQVIFT